MRYDYFYCATATTVNWKQTGTLSMGMIEMVVCQWAEKYDNHMADSWLTSDSMKILSTLKNANESFIQTIHHGCSNLLRNSLKKFCTNNFPSDAPSFCCSSGLSNSPVKWSMKIDNFDVGLLLRIRATHMQYDNCSEIPGGCLPPFEHVLPPK